MRGHLRQRLLPTPGAQLRLPITPPPFRNHGNYVISLNQFVKWLAGQVEAGGHRSVHGASPASRCCSRASAWSASAPATAASARTATPAGTVEPGRRHPRQGHDLRRRRPRPPHQAAAARAAARRTRAGAVRDRPQGAVGRPGRPPGAGTVIHTLGYPLRAGGVRRQLASTRCRRAASRSASSSASTTTIRCSIRTPRSSASSCTRSSPTCCAGGHLVRFGAKALPEGGWNTQPTLYADGALIAGDAANFVNSMRLKGIHLAMRSGMLAAETAFDAVRAGDTSAAPARGATRPRSTPARSAPSCIRCATSTRRSPAALYAGAAFAGLAMADRRRVGRATLDRPARATRGWRRSTPTTA